MKIDLTIYSEIIKSCYDIVSDSYINKGHCFYWAWLVKLAHPEAQLCYTSGHAFIKIGNRYYDAESPRGVNRPANLKCMYINEYTFENVSNRVFQSYWDKLWSGRLNWL